MGERPRAPRPGPAPQAGPSRSKRQHEVDQKGVLPGRPQAKCRPDPRVPMDATLRRSIYSIMLIAATGMMVARVANVEFLYEPSLYKAYPQRKWPDKAPEPWPTYSSNDRARWATVKALVEDHTFVVGQRVPDTNDPRGYHDEGLVQTEGFKSVDYVLHPDRQEFFSTKPPLLT